MTSKNKPLKGTPAQVAETRSNQARAALRRVMRARIEQRAKGNETTGYYQFLVGCYQDIFWRGDYTNA